MAERPVRPVSAQTQQRIAAGIDADAQWAEEHGYPETAAEYRQRAASYRERTGQGGQPQQSG